MNNKNNLRKTMFMMVFSILLVSILSASYVNANEIPGDIKYSLPESRGDSIVEVEESAGLLSLFSLFSFIAAPSEITVEDTLNLEEVLTNWDLKCSDARMVLEVYQN